MRKRKRKKEKVEMESKKELKRRGEEVGEDKKKSWPRARNKRGAYLSINKKNNNDSSVG